ncbi:hypothetical protein A3J41_01385 [candidate division TM6 bacterium RIFCSPHIGHO2_12_FULL_38_8]|nr:MAG: hypothetical protein A3J41_01385 [candidate division TM6 bacterium RIFCSPHIGHO2_12_FULL_38_8]
MEKWSKIVQISFVLIGFTCHDQLLSKMSKYHEKKLIKQLAKINFAQVWYQKMIAKYPHAGLENEQLAVCPDEVGWCVGTEKGSDKEMIGCPRDKYFGNIPFDTADEFFLLHEMGHIKNHAAYPIFHDKKQHEKLGKRLAISTMVALNLSLCLALKDDLQRDYKINDYVIPKKYYFFPMLMAINYWLYKHSNFVDSCKETVVFTCEKFDESWADDFACQTVDSPALVGGYQHFIDYHNKIMKILAEKNIDISIWELRLQLFFKDTHPFALDRAKKIENTLHYRYGQKMPIAA